MARSAIIRTSVIVTKRRCSTDSEASVGVTLLLAVYATRQFPNGRERSKWTSYPEAASQKTSINEGHLSLSLKYTIAGWCTSHHCTTIQQTVHSHYRSYLDSAHSIPFIPPHDVIRDDLAPSKLDEQQATFWRARKPLGQAYRPRRGSQGPRCR